MDCIISENLESQDIQTMPKETSYFLKLKNSGHPTALPKHLFGQSSNLHVLIFCRCTFSFASPPFASCSNLRFIFIEGCRDEVAELISKGDENEA